MKIDVLSVFDDLSGLIAEDGCIPTNVFEARVALVDLIAEGAYKIDRRNAIEASVEYLKGALDDVYKLSGSALLAGEKCGKADAGICYGLACSVIGSLIAAISDLEAIKDTQP